LSRILEQGQQQLDFMIKRIRHQKNAIEQQQTQLDQLKRRFTANSCSKSLRATKNAKANLAPSSEEISPNSTNRFKTDKTSSTRHCSCPRFTAKPP